MPKRYFWIQLSSGMIIPRQPTIWNNDYHLKWRETKQGNLVFCMLYFKWRSSFNPKDVPRDACKNKFLLFNRFKRPKNECFDWNSTIIVMFNNVPSGEFFLHALVFIFQFASTASITAGASFESWCALAGMKTRKRRKLWWWISLNGKFSLVVPSNPWWRRYASF